MLIDWRNLPAGIDDDASRTLGALGYTESAKEGTSSKGQTRLARLLEESPSRDCLHERIPFPYRELTKRQLFAAATERAGHNAKVASLTRARVNVSRQRSIRAELEVCQ